MAMDDKNKYDEYRQLSMNDLRILLYEAGVDWPDDASREDLIKLHKKVSHW